VKWSLMRIARARDFRGTPILTAEADRGRWWRILVDR